MFTVSRYGGICVHVQMNGYVMSLSIRERERERGREREREGGRERELRSTILDGFGKSFACFQECWCVVAAHELTEVARHLLQLGRLCVCVCVCVCV